MENSDEEKPEDLGELLPPCQEKATTFIEFPCGQVHHKVVFLFFSVFYLIYTVYECAKGIYYLLSGYLLVIGWGLFYFTFAVTKVVVLIMAVVCIVRNRNSKYLHTFSTLLAISAIFHAIVTVKEMIILIGAKMSHKESEHLIGTQLLVLFTLWSFFIITIETVFCQVAKKAALYIQEKEAIAQVRPLIVL